VLTAVYIADRQAWCDYGSTTWSSTSTTMDRDDLDLGDEPLEVERPPRAGLIVSVRLSPDEADRLEELAEQRGTTLSQLARGIIAEYLDRGSRRSSVAAR
jgi:hypothetical protein